MKIQWVNLHEGAIGPGASQLTPVVKSLPSREAGDAGSVPGLERSPGGGHDNPLQYSCLENPMDREAWWVTVNRVAENWVRKQQLELDMEQQTGSKQEKEYVKAVYCHPACLTYLQSTS